MNITILDNREIIIDSSDNFGTQNENKASIINFSFPESLINANKKIVFITDDGNFWDLIVNNSYKITNAVTKYKSVSAYVWLVDAENDIDFRSKMWKMTFNKNQQPDDVVPSEEQISVFDTMISQLNTAISEVDNINVDAEKIDNVATITVINKDGTEKSVEINDGEDYIITEEDYENIAEIVESHISTDGYTKAETDNLLSNKVDKETGKELIETTKITKLDGIENGAEVNIIEGVKVNGTELTPENKLVDISVPVDLKDLNEDSTHRTVTDTEKTTWNNKSDFSGNYNDLSNKPTIPTKTSDLTNDSGFIDNTVNNLINYTLKTNTGSLIDLEINSTTYVVTLSLKDIDGTVISTDTIDLPLESVVVSGRYDNTTKQVILTLENGSEVSFSVADLVAGLQTEITSSNKLDSDLVDDSNSGNKFVTTSEKNTWNAKYDKPSGGIPDTDLSSAVQTSLGKADTALQEETYTGTITSVKMNGNTIATSGEADLGTVITEHQDITGKEDKSNKVTSIDENSTNTQYPGAKLVYDELAERDEYIEELEAQIPENTVTGTDITVTDSADMKIAEFELEGQTEQVQYSGKNLLINNATNGSNNGITWTIQSDGGIKIQGTTTAQTVIPVTFSTSFELAAGTYTLSGQNITAENMSLQIWHSTASLLAQAGVNPKKITINNDTTYQNFRSQIVVPNGLTIDTIIYCQLESGSSATSYEPYVGGTASPNPDYPQDIHVVTGNCNVKVQNKNLFISNPDTTTQNGISVVDNGNGSVTLNGTATANRTLVVGTTGITKIGTYSVKGNVLSGTYKTARVRMSVKNATNTANYSDSTINENSTFTVTQSMLESMGNIIVWIESGAVLKNLVIATQMYDSTVDSTSYVPRSEQNYPVSLMGKNLFDKENMTRGYLNSSGEVIDNIVWGISNYIEVFENTTYTISGNNNYTAGNGVSACYYNSSKELIQTIAYSDYRNAVSQITTPTNAKYLRLSIFVDGTASNANTLQIEQGSTATSYASYYNYELCKIGDYQDYIYGSTDDWYIKRVIRDYKVTGEERFYGETTTPAGLTRFYFNPGKAAIANNNILLAKSNLLLGVEGNKLLTTSVDSVLASGIYINFVLKDITTIADLKTMLQEKDLHVYYALGEGIETEKITDTTLISQLNALYKAKTYKNTTHITTTGEDLQPILKLTYKQDLEEELNNVYTKNEMNDIIGADAYDSTATYAVGDICIYNNTLYECNTTIATAENFTPAHWTAVTVLDKMEKACATGWINRQTMTVSTAWTDVKIPISRIGTNQSNKLILNNGEIVIGSGVKNVLVSCILRPLSSALIGLEFDLMIKINNETMYTCYKKISSEIDNVITIPALSNVSEGDTISVYFVTGYVGDIEILVSNITIQEV